MNLFALLTQPWPWYVAGPLIGLTVPLLLLLGNKQFGISSNFEHICAMLPSRISHFNYDWRKHLWSLVFAAGIMLGGLMAGLILANPDGVQLAEATQRELTALGVSNDGGLAPQALFSWSSLFTLRGALLMIGGGFLIGFGTRYAGGCTSGHAITGLSQWQLPSLIAVIGFFAGGLLLTHLLLPLILAL